MLLQGYSILHVLGWNEKTLDPPFSTNILGG